MPVKKQLIRPRVFVRVPGNNYDHVTSDLVFFLSGRDGEKHESNDANPTDSLYGTITRGYPQAIAFGDTETMFFF